MLLSLIFQFSIFAFVSVVNLASNSGTSWRVLLQKVSPRQAYNPGMDSPSIFPYNWSNPAMAEDKIVAAALDRCLFDDLCLLALRHGIPALQAARGRLAPDPLRDRSLDRMLRNIEAGFAAT